ncbi:MAG: tRNA (adenosine(37)-N6)-threonylcarbamoyltransferase complex transferase subunit TsaD, partial [Candidatus Omnitrophota bacterium]
MIVLGIETSCDETSASMVKNGKDVLSNIVYSSIRFHKKYGGVIPEIASRVHSEVIDRVTRKALLDAHLKFKNIDLIAVTKGPGLVGSLLTGISFAKALSLGLNRPLIGVDHLQAHLYANFLNNNFKKNPFIGLVISGGHTSIFFVKNWLNFKL